MKTLNDHTSVTGTGSKRATGWWGRQRALVLPPAFSEWVCVVKVPRAGATACATRVCMQVFVALFSKEPVDGRGLQFLYWLIDMVSTAGAGGRCTACVPHGRGLTLHALVLTLVAHELLCSTVWQQPRRPWHNCGSTVYGRAVRAPWAQVPPPRHTGGGHSTVELMTEFSRTVGTRAPLPRLCQVARQ